jgi:hypothetical protein
MLSLPLQETAADPSTKSNERYGREGSRALKLYAIQGTTRQSLLDFAS